MNKKITGGLTSLLLAGVVAAGVCCAGFASRNDDGKWFKNSDLSTWHWSDKSPADADNGEDNNEVGELVKETQSNGISLMSALIEPEDYANYNIDARAAKAYTITATVNEDAVQKALSCGISWKNPSSSWAASKTVTSYVSVDQSSDLVFTLTVKEAIGEPVILNIHSSFDKSINATAEINYLKEMTSFTATLNPSLPSGYVGRIHVKDTQNTVQINPVYGVGTVTGTISGYKTTFTTTDWFRTKLKEELDKSSAFKSYSPKETISVTGQTFTLPIASSCLTFLNGGGSSDVYIVLNNFIRSYGRTNSLGVEYLAGASSTKYEITYSYGSSYSKALSYTDNTLIAFNCDDVSPISTVTKIELDKTNIVVIP